VSIRRASRAEFRIAVDALSQAVAAQALTGAGLLKISRVSARPVATAQSRRSRNSPGQGRSLQSPWTRSPPPNPELRNGTTQPRATLFAHMSHRSRLQLSAIIPHIRGRRIPSDHRPSNGLLTAPALPAAAAESPSTAPPAREPPTRGTGPTSPPRDRDARPQGRA